MTSKPEQMKLKLSLATPLTLPETKVLLKELFAEVEELKNEIRKISQNRTGVNQISGKSLPTS